MCVVEERKLGMEIMSLLLVIRMQVVTMEVQETKPCLYLRLGLSPIHSALPKNPIFIRIS